MKMRLTISDEVGSELVSQIFEITGRDDYEQANNEMWDRLREKLAKKEGDDPFWNDPFAGSITPRGGEPSSEPPLAQSQTWKEADRDDDA